MTDAGLTRTGIPGRVAAALTQAGVESAIFDAVEANPSIETVERALQVYRDQGCDGLVAVGGGSPMDAAKAVGVLASNPGKLLDYVGLGKVARPLPILIAIPTTTGTGSEVTQFTVITDHAQRRKVVIGGPQVAPSHALLDPELVANLPAGLVGATAMDALTHAVESVISTFASPFTDGLALQAIRMIADNLPEPAAPAARANLLYASTMAGMAFSYARTGLVHGMAHPLSAYYDVPHGLANAILLPHVLGYNAPACEPALARVAEALGQPRRQRRRDCGHPAVGPRGRDSAQPEFGGRHRGVHPADVQRRVPERQRAARQPAQADPGGCGDAVPASAVEGCCQCSICRFRGFC